MKQKRHEEKHGILAFKPLLQEWSDEKTWLSERFSEALTSKLWNKKIHAVKAYRNGAKFNYIYSPLMVISKTLDRLI